MSEDRLVEIILEMNPIVLENLLKNFKIIEKDAYQIFAELVEDAD